MTAPQQRDEPEQAPHPIDVELYNRLYRERNGDPQALERERVTRSLRPCARINPPKRRRRRYDEDEDAA